jgi:hypothetical protein
MTSPQSLCIGPYGVGERPEALECAFQTSRGAALVLTGFTAWVELRRPDGSVETYTTEVIIVDAALGKVAFQWPDNVMDTAGKRYLLWFWVESGANRLSSLPFEFDVVERGYVPV